MFKIRMSGLPMLQTAWQKREYGAITLKNEGMLGKTIYLMNVMSISGELGHFCVLHSKCFLMSQPFSMLIAVSRTYRCFRKSGMDEKISLFVAISSKHNFLLRWLRFGVRRSLFGGQRPTFESPTYPTQRAATDIIAFLIFAGP